MTEYTDTEQETTAEYHECGHVHDPELPCPEVRDDGTCEEWQCYLCVRS